MVQVTEGKVGRVILVRIDHGEDLFLTLTRVAEERGIRHGAVQIFGAVASGTLVSGPEKPVLPPVTHEETFHGGWDLLGIGSIYPCGAGVKLHLHVSEGRHRTVFTGCLRAAEVYIIIEAMIMELIGISGEITHDPKTGIALPDFRTRVELRDGLSPSE